MFFKQNISDKLTLEKRGVVLLTFSGNVILFDYHPHRGIWSITSWQIDGETVETVTDFIFLDSKKHCKW